MGRGVALNKNTYHKMSQNGLIEWSVKGDIIHNFTAEYDRFTLQLVEDDTPTHYEVLKVYNDPWETLKKYYNEHKNIPRVCEEDFKRSWKNQVKRKFNASGWLRK